MKKLKILVVTGVTTLTAVSCSTGDLRAFNDAMSGSNGYTVTYPDQRDTEYVGDIKWTTGVKNNSGFEIIKNTGDDYCKIKVDYENGDDRIFRLDPGESTGSMYVSLYNQSEYMSTLCNTSSAVFDSSFSE